MNKNQRYKLAMYKAVDKVFDDNITLVATIVALADAANELKKIIIQIEDQLSVQEELSGSASTMKKNVESIMIKSVTKLAGYIASYAHDNDITDLEMKMNLSGSKLSHMPDEVLETNCRNVLASGRKYYTNMTQYPVSAEKLDAIEKEIDAYTALLTQPRSQIITRAQATRQLKDYIDSGYALLKNKADKLMAEFEVSESLFYNTYKLARKIIDKGRPGTKNNADETVDPAV